MFVHVRAKAFEVLPPVIIGVHRDLVSILRSAAKRVVVREIIRISANGNASHEEKNNCIQHVRNTRGSPSGGAGCVGGEKSLYAVGNKNVYKRKCRQNRPQADIKRGDKC